MKKLLFAIFCLTFSIHLYAAKLDLSEISTTVQELIFNQFPKVQNGEVEKSDLDKVIRFLVSQDIFDSVEILQTDTNQYKLKVGKNKKIIKISFAGINYFSENEIKKEFAISEKSNFDQQLLIEAGERIRKLYNDKAFENAVVDLEFHPLSEQEIEVKVSISENKQLLIKSIDVSSENKKLARSLEKILRKKINEPHTETTLAELQKIARDHFTEKGYLTAELIGPEVTQNQNATEAQLSFRVDKPYQYEIVLKNYKEFSTRELNNALTLDKFYSSNPLIGPELATKLKKFYLSKGFARIDIKSDESEVDDQFIKKVTLILNEGPLVKIKSIEFTGRFSQSSDFYKKLLMNNASDLIKDDLYNRDDLDLALKNLVIQRQNQGFLKAKMVSSRSTYSKEKDQISILINFDEGPMTLVQKILFTGNSSYSYQDLNSVLGLETNRPLKLNLLEESILKLKNFYRNNGFLEMVLINEKEELVKYNADSTLADLDFKIHEGPRITVGSILIEGNSLTTDYVINKELDFKKGDILTPQKVDETISRLQKLGHFNSVDIRTLEDKTEIANRTVIVRVSDRDPGLFNMGLGFSNERQLTLRGYLGVAYRNIEGTGRGASARIDMNYNIADIKYLERKGSLGYLEPYLFNTRTKGKINFTQSNTINPLDDKSGVELRQLVFSIEQDISSHILVSFDLWNKSTYRDYYLKQESDHKNRLDIASIGPTLDLDFRDHPFNPTKGTFSRLNIEYASPNLGSNDSIEFLRGTAGFTHYYPINEPATWVWANSVRGGYLKNLSQQPGYGVPWDKKGLIFGGQSTIRGFTVGESFPNRQDFINAYVENKMDISTIPEPYLLKTEASSYLIKSEIRFPIYGNFGGAFFYDGGSIVTSDVAFKDSYRDAVGVAFRYATPVGAVSFELGYKLDQKKERNEDQFPFHFSIGTF